MVHSLIVLVALLTCFPVFAQVPKITIFGDGRRPSFKTEEIDKKFMRSRLARALNEGTSDDNCKALLGGLLTALAETAPFFHNRDENLHVDPHLLAAIESQLNSPTFPASAYFVTMARQVLIKKRMPEEWLKTAEKINATYNIIDLSKLKMISEGLSPIDSFLLTLPMLKQRFDEDVLSVTSASKTDVLTEFKDTYIDREVSFSGLQLVDIKIPPRNTRQQRTATPLSQLEALVAELTWVIPGQQTNSHTFGLERPRPPKAIVVRALLTPRQYINLDRIPKGAKLIVKGRLWSTNEDLTKVEIHNALLFEDRDWSKGVLLALPGMTDKCPFTTNDLMGILPEQPGGFNRNRR
ncbi:MAG: hypothetical protein FWG75_00150 [Cystobacterineae bacterium]|nr:hypothetical protein [Cystobacterineae bacterium]